MFSDKKVLDRLKELDVMLVKADNTSRIKAISVDLRRYGRAGLPTNLIFPADPDVPAIQMPEIFGAADALEALEQAVAASK